MNGGEQVEVRVGASPGEAAAILRPALVLWLVVQLTYAAFWLWVGYGDQSARSAGLETVVHFVLMVAVAVVIVRFVRRDPEARRVLARPRRGMVELCLITGIAGAIALAMLERGIGAQGDHGSEPALSETARTAALAVAAVGSVIMPAVFEELMFRGLLQHRLQLVLGTRFAVAVQAMLFALLHCDAVLLLPHFAFGCLAGFLRVAAGALWPCMLMHACWNGWIVFQRYGVV